MDNNNPPVPVPDAVANVPAAGGDGNVEVANLKDVINEALGTTYATDEAAIEGLKNTKSYVGEFGKFKPHLDTLRNVLGGDEQVLKYMADITNPQGVVPQPQPNQPLDTSKFATREEVDALVNQNFFNANPDFLPYQKTMLDLAKANGVSLSQVPELESFKGIYSMAQIGKQSESNKSVLQTNPRIGAVSDKLTQAKDAVAQGNSAQAGDLATAAVLDAFGMK